MENFINFYQQFNQQSVSQLSRVYADEIVFIDPVATHRGLPALTNYFSNLLSNTHSCNFCIEDYRHIEQSGFISWQMNFRHGKLNAGKNIQVEGFSQVEIVNNKIVYQRDYYDLGNMLYEQLPLIGGIIRYLKRKLI